MTTFTIKASTAQTNSQPKYWYVLAHLLPNEPPIVAAICNSANWAQQIKLALELLQAARKQRATRTPRRLRQARAA